MQLDFETIRQITCGAAQIWPEDGGLRFSRFTAQQEQMYALRDPMPVEPGCLASTGVRLAFSTNSPWVYLKADVRRGSSRSFFAFDLCVNGKLVDSLENFGNYTYLPGKPYKAEFPLGVYEKQFALGEGEKTVEVYFPWNACPILQELSLADGATLKPVKRPGKLLVYGDSITQGYDCLHPTAHHIPRLAAHLHADVWNKAVGGEIFFPELADSPEDFEPEDILVAYGTNDLSSTDGDDFDRRCGDFYRNLSKRYPNARIFAITPIWREDYNKAHKFGTFDELVLRLRKAIAQIPNLTVIDGFDLVPHDPVYFSDLKVHPNDAGYLHYGNNLCRQIDASR